jgi:hypothetical protein
MHSCSKNNPSGTFMIGLPSNYFPLVASGRDAFVNPGDSIVGHGGISIEEVDLPPTTSPLHKLVSSGNHCNVPAVGNTNGSGLVMMV